MLKKYFFITVLTIFSLIQLNYYYPISLLNFAPKIADLASHYQTFKFYKLSGSFLPFWNPYQGFGEVSLLNYFPAPFYFMRVLSWKLPEVISFNSVVYFGNVMLVISLGLFYFKLFNSWAEAIVSVLLCTLVINTLDVDFWGGTAYSSWVGQFGSVYAVSFLLLFGIELNKFIEGKRRSPLSSVIVASLTLLSHSIIALVLPIFVIEALIFSSDKRKVIRKSTVVFVLTGVVTAYFWVPFVENLPWANLILSSRGFVGRELTYYFPEFMILIISLVVFANVYSLLREKKMGQRWGLPVRKLVVLSFSLLIISSVLSFVGFTVGRYLRLWQYLFCGLLVGLIFEWVSLLRISHGRIVRAVLVGAILVFSFLGDRNTVSRFFKMQFDEDHKNYVLPELEEKFLNAGFTRIGVSNLVGMSSDFYQDFNLAPMAFGVSVLGSLYQESSYMNPYWMFYKNILFDRRQCFDKFRCAPDSKTAEFFNMINDRFAVNYIVTQSKESFEALTDNKRFYPIRSLGHGLYFSERIEKLPFVSLVGPGKFSVHSVHEYSKEYEIESFVNGTLEGRRRIFFNEKPKEFNIDGVVQSNAKVNCDPSVMTSLNLVVLETDCVGFLHEIPIAYSPNFRSQNSTLGLISPGFLGVIPYKDRIEITFKRSWIGRISDFLSALGIFGMLGLSFARRCYPFIKTKFYKN